jgi:hypothetical protein
MRLAALLLLGALLGPARAQQPNVGAIQVFPPDNPWNWDISGHNVHPLSATYVASIGTGAEVRADFAFEINVVNGGTPTTVNFVTFANQSDPGPGFGSPIGGATSGAYRFPSSPRVEGNGVGDAHCIAVDVLNGLLYETYQMNLSTTPWSAANGAIFDLNSNALRRDGWTSGDAAGLPIFPGLLRYEEIVAGEIKHALRVTVPNSQNAYLYPARHQAGSANAAYPPMGLRLRLKAGVDLSGYSGAPLIVMTALKKYGLIVADNGSPWYISTTVDDRWDPVSGVPYINSATVGLRSLHGSDFEAVETVDLAGNPIPPGSVPPPSGGGGGGGGGGGCGATGLEPLLLLAFRRVRRS